MMIATRDPDKQVALYLKASDLAAAGKRRQARAILYKLVKLYPRSVRVLLLLSRVAESQPRRSEFATRAVKVDGYSPVVKEVFITVTTEKPESSIDRLVKDVNDTTTNLYPFIIAASVVLAIIVFAFMAH